MVLIARKLPASRFGKALVLDAAIHADAGDEDAARLVGLDGKAVTALRPAGTVELAGRRVDVVSEGGFIEAGAPVRVVSAEGTRVVVGPITK